jgi:hypothetical protein
MLTHTKEVGYKTWHNSVRGNVQKGHLIVSFYYPLPSYFLSWYNKTREQVTNQARQYFPFFSRLRAR